MCVFFGCVSVVCAEVFHVSVGGDDSADGKTWGRAVAGVGRGLELASAGDAVWVSQGTYACSVNLGAGVSLYGGFRGDELTLQERDPLKYPSILDGGDTNIVVLVEGGGRETVLDGFAVQRGRGCGVRLYNAGAKITNNRIRWNTSSEALAYGAGISVKNLASDAVALIEGNVILENYAFDGGGISCIDASPEIVGNVIAWNTAMQNGGGISCWRSASPRIERNWIYGNTASWVQGSGPVEVGGGGIFATADDLDGRPHPTARSSPLVLGNVIAANGGAKGAGVAVVDANGGVPQLLNNTVVANAGSGICWGSSGLVPLVPIVVNNIVAFNPRGIELIPGTPDEALFAHNCVYGNRVFEEQGDFSGLVNPVGSEGNISVDPGLVCLSLGRVHLRSDSPCRDAGTGELERMPVLDIDGSVRGEWGLPDIGADEIDGGVWPWQATVVRVSTAGSDDADGSGWDSAKRTVQAALDAIRPSGGEVWVAEGVYDGGVWLPAFVHVYGGFAGDEAERDLRDPGAHPTVLDGNGVPNVVISGQGGFRVSTLDGFTVTGGGDYTGGLTLNKYGVGGKGGGILVAVSGPIIANNVITRNSLAYDNTAEMRPSYGAGIACDLAYPVIEGNRIIENEILNDFDGSGGGVHCVRSRPLIRDNEIHGNRAAYGSAIFCEASAPVILHNSIRGNGMYELPPLFGGAAQGAVTIQLAEDAVLEGNWFEANKAAVGAGLYLAAYHAATVRNNVFLNNTAGQPSLAGGMGGGLYVMVTTNVVAPVEVIHNTLIGNDAGSPFGEQGGALAFTLVPPADGLVIANNLVVSNSSGFFQTLTAPMPVPVLAANNLFNAGGDYLNLDAGVSDIHRAPTFVDWAGHDFRPALESADVDAADARYSFGRDIEGVLRPLDGNADGVAGSDLGAFEVIHPLADTESDGLPDVWEIAFGLDPLSNDAASDADADGLVNASEYAAGTDPLDARSVLALTLASLPGGGVQLSWRAVSGKSYALMRSTDPAAGDWSTVSEYGMEQSQTFTVELESTGESSFFYQLQLR